MASLSHMIKQGDAYAIPVRLTLNGEPLTAAHLDLIDAVEFMVGEDIRKVYPEDVSFDRENSRFLVPVTQTETFALEEGERISLDVRVAFHGGAVVGTKSMESIGVCDALSEVEL